MSLSLKKRVQKDPSLLFDQRRYWIDREGQVWTIREMSTSHLRNLLRWLDRQAMAVPFPNFQGEMAQYYAEQDWVRVQEGEYPLYEAVAAELTRRERAAKGEQR